MLTLRTRRTLKTALTALRVNKMRAALTALGIIIGIASVIVMMEIGQGSSKAIKQTIESMGANNILVLPGTAASGGVSFGAGSSRTLTVSDAEAINREISQIKGAAPIVRARTQVVYGNRNWVPQYIYGTTPTYLQIRDWDDLKEGAAFTDADVRGARKVCILGETLVRQLFQGVSPVGKEIRVQNVALKVVGVVRSKGANMMGMDQDDIIIAPWTTIKYRVTGESSSSSTSPAGTSAATDAQSTRSNSDIYPSTSVEFYPAPGPSSQFLSRRVDNVDQIILATDSSDITDQIIDQLTLLLRDRHRLRPDQDNDFGIRNMAEMSKALSSTSILMTRLLLGVALISLIVGGVGIMNIMLVSVTERTREIGLRMAVGARGRDIMQQFLIEAVVLCLAGGIIGILLGRGISTLIRVVAGWPIETSLPAIVAACAVSISVGLIFGYYPASKAARLDPIEALRYE